MKKEEKTGLTKERILLAAMEEFGEKGYAAASLNNICAAGIPKGLLYHNYENKDALYLACVKQSFSILMNCLQEKGGDGGLQEYMEARLLFGITLRKGVTQEAAMEYFTLMQSMFNGYFSSPACSGMPFTDIVKAHETKLSVFLDYMLYGMAERGEKE